MSDGAPQSQDNSNNICSRSSEGPAPNQFKTLQLPLYQNIPNTVTLDCKKLHSSQTTAEVRGSVSVDVSESPDTHSMTKTDGL